MLITRKDIVNERQRLRKEQLDGLSPTQAMLVSLEEYNKDEKDRRYVYSYHLHPDTQEVDYLFFAHPGSVELLIDNYDVIMIDSTYSTNKYNMPLAHITGRTCSGRAFDIAFCCLNQDREETYNLVVDDLAAIYESRIPGAKPTVIVTDKEKALKNALRKSTFFGIVPQIICQWHTKMNVLSKASAKWSDNKAE